MRAANAYLCGAIMASYIIQAMVFLGVAILVSWQATLAALAAGIVILIMLSRLIGKARRAGMKQTKLLQSLLAQLTDSLQSIKPLKAMAREKLADSVLQSETNRLNKALRKQVFSKEALKALRRYEFEYNILNKFKEEEEWGNFSFFSDVQIKSY